MTKPHLEKMLKKELETLNDTIDRKIIKGESYTREAKRHKFLYSRILAVQKEYRPSLFYRFIGASAAF